MILQYMSMLAYHQQIWPGLMNRPIEPVPNLIREYSNLR